MANALAGIDKLKRECDTLIVIPNDKPGSSRQKDNDAGSFEES